MVEFSIKGRVCSSCGQHKAWDRYNKKSNGINGYDSRCKVCINKAKKSYRRNKIKRYVESETLRSVIIGSADQDKVDLIGRVLATSIMTLIDNGKIR